MARSELRNAFDRVMGSEIPTQPTSIDAPRASVLDARLTRRAAIVATPVATIVTWEAAKAILGGVEVKVAKATQPDADREHKKTRDAEGKVVYQQEIVGKNEIIVSQGDDAPNGDKKWRDSDPNTTLITLYNTNKDQVGLVVDVSEGADWAIFTYDECPTPGRSFEDAQKRANEYAQEMRQLKIDGTGATGKKWERADIKVYGVDPAQGK